MIFIMQRLIWGLRTKLEAPLAVTKNNNAVTGTAARRGGKVPHIAALMRASVTGLG